MNRGFTLIELMIVVAIISILAMIAVPKIGNTIRKSNESSTRAKLNSVRKALSVYYADNEGYYPSDLSVLMQPGSKYLSGTVPAYTAEHGNSPSVSNRTGFDASTDTGGWGYVNDGSSSDWGKVWVECTHTDMQSQSWNQY